MFSQRFEIDDTGDFDGTLRLTGRDTTCAPAELTTGLDLYEGQTNTLKIQMRYQPDGVDYDLAGYVVRFKARANYQSTDLLLDLASDDTDPAIIIDANPTIAITISAADVAELTVLAGIFHVEMESAGGVVTQIVGGTFYVRKTGAALG